MDQEGDKIQASIMNKSLFKQFQKDPVEGQCYFIANLEVIPKGKDYKATNHKFKLLFNSATYVKGETAAIPLSVFNFFPIRDILTQTVENHTMCLFDVIGFVISIGPLEEYHSGAEVKSKLRLILGDERENYVHMVLYDDCALKFSTHDFNAMQKPIVLVAQLVRIGFNERGQPEVCSSFHATKIHLNGKFSEVAEFITSAENLPSPTITSLTPTVETQKSTSAAESILKNTPRIKVSEIPLQEVEKYFAVMCEFKKFETRHGWVYEGCSRCGTKPKMTNGLVSCGSNYCKGKQCTIQSKLRLNYLIADESGTASIVLFDKHASEILRKSAAQLKAEIPKEAMCYEFPSEVNNLIGKKMLLKIKLNKYNKEHPNSSISVTTYAECADLIDAFDAAASELGQPSGLSNDDEEDIIFLRNGTVEDKGLANAEPYVTLSESLPTIELDEVSISDNMHVVPSKGKRKVSSKKPAAHGSKVAIYGPSSPAKTSSKPLKSIKQEKN